MFDKTRTLQLAFATSATLMVAPLSQAHGQEAAHHTNQEEVKTLAAAGCSGASWARTRTITGEDYPVITELEDGSPAKRAGLKQGDVVLAVNGVDARTLDAWFVATPGEKVRVRVQRGTKVHEVTLHAGRVFEISPVKYEVQCLSSDVYQ